MDRRGFLKLFSKATVAVAVAPSAFIMAAPEGGSSVAKKLLNDPVQLGVSQRGRGQLEAGYVFAPYYTVYMTPQIQV